MTYRIFFSYSESRSPNLVTAKTIRDKVIAKCSHEGWTPVDPMDRRETGYIRDKVEDDLDLCDALIADVSGAPPNVLFEIGYARARRIPVVVLCRAELDGPEAGEMGEMPADLGDLEVHLYDNTLTPAEDQKVTEMLGEVLDSLASRMSPGSAAIREQHRCLRDRLEEIQKEWVDQTDPLLLRFLSGWLASVARELTEGSTHEFFVDPDYYQDCFGMFHQSEKVEARAIADLSDDTEGLWVDRDPQTSMAVNERIFLISSEDFLNRDRLEHLFTLLKNHRVKEGSKSYSILVARAKHPERPKAHPFEGSRGQDILIYGHDFVSGYVARGEPPNERSYLRVVASGDLGKRAHEYYAAIRKRAFPFDVAWTDPFAMRAAWLEMDDVGLWDERWTIGYRTPRYYQDYDSHIRCWVPRYRALIRITAERVVEEAAKVNRRSGDMTLKILEIGSGTGALTHAIQKSLVGKGRDFPQTTLVALDKAECMISHAGQRIQSVDISIKLVQGTAFDDLPSEVKEHGPYDVICGSLVLSHIMGDQPTDQFPIMVEQCCGLLSEYGSLVLADSLVLNPDDREQVKRDWKGWMAGQGMGKDSIRAFFEGNVAMVKTVSKQTINEAAAAIGYVAVFDQLVAMGVDGFSPCKILTMRRTEEA